MMKRKKFTTDLKVFIVVGIVYALLCAATLSAAIDICPHTPTRTSLHSLVEIPTT